MIASSPQLGIQPQVVSDLQKPLAHDIADIKGLVACTVSQKKFGHNGSGLYSCSCLVAGSGD